MIGKINKRLSTTETASPNELSGAELQKNTAPQVSHDTENSQKNLSAMENMATDRKVMGSVEATVVRADIEKNWGETQKGVVGNNTKPSESMQEAIDEATSQNLTLNFTRVE